ncbi:CapA family protein [Sinorhizobium meliloti]|uniref:CapA family protein n=1 Tax=Rhizobium meliloti TaxID=382 RepID=UPI000FD81192|nr:CapA family protein [Sinorhizobium meliloti]RVH99935.1 CapA family protein [Sinorhizobium meliloti]RVO20340.1 CapA family protein [Sinorhizobium meliloti]
MKERLPSTYLDICKSPTLLHALKLRALLLSAKAFGYWDKPRSTATEDPAEWSFVEEAYGLYKYIRPTTEGQNGVAGVLFANDNSSVRLPKDFVGQASLTIGAAGDLMPAEGLEHSKDFLYESVSDILFDVDVSFANLEAPVTAQKVEVKFVGGDSPPIMGFTVAEFPTIVRHKGKTFTALSFANNHTFDRGLEGLETTQRIFDEYGISDVGTPRSPDAFGRARIVEKNGIKIGFIAVTYSLNGLDLPESEKHRVHVSRLSSRSVAPDLNLLRDQIADCKANECDFIIASLHWGYECEFLPRQRQIDVAHTLVEEGVDLIIGHHPHVIQPIEYFRPERDPDRIAVIAYSLGGLGFRWYTAPHFALGLILNMELSKGLLDGTCRTYIKHITPHPVFQNILVSYFGGVKMKRVEKLDSYLLAEGSREGRQYLSQLKRYADMVLGREVS